MAGLVTALYQTRNHISTLPLKYKQLTNAVILPSLVNHFRQQDHDFLQDTLA